MSTDNIMIAMIDSFNRKRQAEEVVGLEDTGLFLYFKQQGEKYQLIKRVNVLLRQKDIRSIIKELDKMFSNGRFLFGFTNSEKYSSLNSEFAGRFGFEQSKEKRKKKEQLATILRKGHPDISEDTVISFLKANRKRFETAIKDAAIIALACDAASHRERYCTNRNNIINSIMNEASGRDNGVITVDKKTAELLMNRLREKTASIYDDKLLIKIESSRFTSASFVIAGNSWVKPGDDIKTGLPKDKINRHFRIHYAHIECDPEGVTVYCPDGDSYDITHEKYMENLKTVESEYPENYPVLKKIEKSGLEIFSSILASKGKEEPESMKTTGSDESAFYPEQILPEI